MPIPIQKIKNGIQFATTIQPRSSKNEITGTHNNTLKIRLTKPPIKGAANLFCIKFLAKTLGVSASQVTIALGSSSRKKIIRVTSLTKENLIKILQSALTGSNY